MGKVDETTTSDLFFFFPPVSGESREPNHISTLDGVQPPDVIPGSLM